MAIALVGADVGIGLVVGARDVVGETVGFVGCGEIVGLGVGEQSLQPLQSQLYVVSICSQVNSDLQLLHD